jgi:hypothetical protein
VCVCVRVCVCVGYYTHISTLADVQENVMEYLHVLSRPMVINHDHDIIWTEAYMDTVVGPPSCGHHSAGPKNSSLLITQCASPFVILISLSGSFVIACIVSSIHIVNVIHNHFILSSAVSLSSPSHGHRCSLSLPLRL